MIKAFNKHYRKAIDLLEDSSSSEKIEMAEKVMEWFKDLPEEYLVSLALFFNEVIDDLGDESLEKINFKRKRKHPRDLIEQALSLAEYRGDPPHLTTELLEAACAGYFVDDTEPAPVYA